MGSVKRGVMRIDESDDRAVLAAYQAWRAHHKSDSTQETGGPVAAGGAVAAKRGRVKRSPTTATIRGASPARRRPSPVSSGK